MIVSMDKKLLQNNNEVKMDNDSIARSALRLRFIVMIGIVLIVTIYLIGELGPQIGPVLVQSQAGAEGWPGTVVTGLTLALFILALVRLAQMLTAIANGPLFGPSVTRAFRGFAFWLFLGTLADVVAPPLVALAGPLSAGRGRAELIFELSDLLMLVGALFLFLLARMLEQARALEAELEEII